MVVKELPIPVDVTNVPLVLGKVINTEESAAVTGATSVKCEFVPRGVALKRICFSLSFSSHRANESSWITPVRINWSLSRIGVSTIVPLPSLVIGIACVGEGVRKGVRLFFGQSLTKLALDYLS